MPGRAIFSNIDAIVYGKSGQAYDRVIKRFGVILRQQKIVPTVRAGYVKNFIEDEMITEEELKKIFAFGWQINDYLYAELTIFTWE